MPAKGGAFFGFAIVVAAALITWGIIALVEVADDDSNDGSSSRSVADNDIQVGGLSWPVLWRVLA